MTAPDPRLGEIEARLTAAAAAPWRVEQHDLSLFVQSADEGLQANLGYVGNRPDKDAEFIANAPADVAYILAELRKRDDALARVEALAASWTARGEHDMAYSKTIPDEDIATAILADGAMKVENARHIRNALKGES